MKPGDIIVNAGRLRGQGYRWRVTELHDRNPHDKADRRAFVSCINIGWLHPARTAEEKQAEKEDYFIGTRNLFLVSEKEVLGSIKPPFQEWLI